MYEIRNVFEAWAQSVTIQCLECWTWSRGPIWLFWSQILKLWIF